jgi:two-component system heavy metal sensor histidine kinase CusS
MRSSLDLRGWLRRADVPLTLALAQAITLLTVALLVLLFGLSSHEAAEVLESALENDIRRVAERFVDHEPLEPHDVGPGAAIRLFDGGAPRWVIGDWPAGGILYDDDTSSVRLAFSSSSDALCDWESLPDGRRLQGCVLLAGFVHERREQLFQLGVSFLAGLFGVLAVSVYATRRALAPLRDATGSIESVDERHLEARIPTRGTGDVVDRHAEALNRVLARLEGSFARMSDFGADVAHELRTPVNRILNLTDVALLRGEPGAAEKSLDAIREAAEQMRRLIEDMLLLARGDEGRLAPKREPLDPDAVLDELADLYRPSCEEEGIALERAPHAGAIVHADRPLLERAVSNLLDNALRHTPRGGAIRIGVEPMPDAALAITVSDSGAGIPPAERERIFDRFVQLDTARGGGAGLGLPIARMIARTLGGDLVASASPLGGARFELQLRC